MATSVCYGCPNIDNYSTEKNVSTYVDYKI